MKMRKYRVKYKNEDTFIDLHSIMVSDNVVSLSYHDATENLSGFIIYDHDGNVIKDCSDFTYRWDVVDNRKNKIYYTNDANNLHTKPFPSIEEMVEEVGSLSNDELTDCVADLMMETSMLSLGLEV